MGIFVRVLAGKPQQPLARAVDRGLLGGDLRTRQREIRGEHRAQILGDAGHRLEALGAADVEPMPDLGDTHVELALAPEPEARARRATAWRAARNARAASFPTQHRRPRLGARQDRVQAGYVSSPGSGCGRALARLLAPMAPRRAARNTPCHSGAPRSFAPVVNCRTGQRGTQRARTPMKWAFLPP